MVFNYQVIADTIGTSNFNYFNGLGNMFLARSQSQNMQMSNAMQSCWTGFMPYGNLSGLSYLTDPRYTIGQMTWGTPMWNGNWTMNTDMWTPWGFTNNGNNNTTKKPETEEEKAYQKKYNVLLSLLKQVKTYPDLLSTQKELIDDAINDAKKGTYEEKYNALLSAYKALDKDKLKDFFTVANKLGATSDIKENSKSDDSFQKRLQATGHEMDDTGATNSTDKIVEDLYTQIELLDDSDSASNLINGDLARVALGQVNILDLISSWNSNYKNKDNKSNRLLGHIMKKHDKLKDKDAKKDVRTVVVVPIVNALVREAERNLKDLTSESKENMNNAIKNLEDALEKYEENGKNGKQVSEAFDNLYVLTRLVATEKLEHGVVDYYGRIEEGTDIEDSDKVFKKGMFTDSMIEDLKAEGFDSEDIQNAKQTVQRKGGSTTQETPENPETPDNNDNGDVTPPGGNGGSTTEDTDMRTAGAEMLETLKGFTEDDLYEDINTTLENIDKDNVMSFLAGYYEDAEGMGRVEGLIERLDDENDGCGADRAIKMENKVNLINSLLDLAEDKGLTNNTHYKAIKRVMNARFSEGLDETRTNFKKGSRLSRFFSKENWLGQASTYVGGGTLAAGGVGAGLAALGLVSNPIGWVAGAIIGGAAICAGVYGLCDGYTDDEFIDEHMEALYKDLKALEQRPTLSATA